MSLYEAALVWSPSTNWRTSQQLERSSREFPPVAEVRRWRPDLRRPHTYLSEEAMAMWLVESFHNCDAGSLVSRVRAVHEVESARPIPVAFRRSCPAIG